MVEKCTSKLQTNVINATDIKVKKKNQENNRCMYYQKLIESRQLDLNNMEYS